MLKRTTLERLLAAFLCVVLLIGLLPVSTFHATAEEGTSTDETISETTPDETTPDETTPDETIPEGEDAVIGLGTVSELSESTMSVSGNDTAAVTVTLSGVTTLSWEDSLGGGRVGMKVVAPAGYDAAAKYLYNGSTENAFADNKNGDDYIWLYGVVTEDYLTTDLDGMLSYKWEFDWDNDGVYEQAFYLNIGIDQVVLLGADGEAVYKPDQNAQISPAATIKVGEKTTVSVTGNAEGSTVSFSTQDTGVIKLTDNGDGTATVEGVSAETATVTAQISGTELYNEAQLSVEITVEALPAPEGNGFAVDSDVIVVNDTKDYLVSIPSEYERTMLQSSDENIATAKLENGKVSVTGVAVGTVEITLRLFDDNFIYMPTSYKLQITVKQEQSALELVCPERVVYNQYTDNQITLSVRGGTVVSGAVTYVSNDNTIASVSGDVLTIHQAGTVTITATKAGNDEYMDVSDSVTVTISKANQDVSLKVASDEIDNSQTSYPIEIVSATNNYAADEFVYTIASYDRTMDECTVDENGVITIADGNYGNIVINVSNNGNECYNRWLGAAFTLTVKQVEIEEGEYTFTGTKGKDADGNETGWYVSNVTISRDGYKLAEHKQTSSNESYSSSYIWTKEGINEVVLCVKPNTGGKAHNQTIGTLKVDKTVPTITMGEPEYAGDFGDVLGEIFSFGFYQSPVNLPLSTQDSVSGVVTIFYSTDGGSTWTRVDGTSTNITVSQSYDANQIQYYCIDAAGNASNKSIVEDEIVYDTVDPTRVVTLSEAKQVVNSTTLETVTGFVYTSENQGVNLYYDAAATVTIAITEDNFEDEHITVKDNGNKIKNVSWTSENNVHTAVITLDSEGKHVITVEGTDKSGRKLATYTSDVIIIDKTNPKLSADPDNSSNASLYGAGQKVTISVEEDNFRADEFVLTVGAVDVTGTAVTGTTYTVGDWYIDNGVHKIDVTFTADAAYTVNASYTDLALHAADLKGQSFTVDASAPTDLSISYSISGDNGIMYSKEPVTVTLTAVDNTSGIESFSYEYNLNSDVSFVNQKGSGTIKEFTLNGNVYTATFTIPKEALSDDNQFNGYVTFTAKDRCGNEATKSHEGEYSIVVDNIAPIREVTYTEPVRTNTDNTVDYFAGDVEVKVKITEANFFQEDVSVSVNYEGTTKTLQPTWEEDTAADTYIGTFTLSEEGDYVITVSYTDRSGNAMEVYTSKTITIDLTDPETEITYSRPAVSIHPENDTADRHYYNDDVEVIVTVKEHNFYAEGMVIDCNGVQVTLNADQWVAAGTDTYTATLYYSNEANYTMNVATEDWAGRVDEEKVAYYTVDMTPPQNLTIDYSDSVTTEKVKDVTVKYYKNPVKVTITAEDAVAGIDEFSYEYILNSNVSSVNKSGSGVVAATLNENGVYEASFEVPAEALTANNQFNGFIVFQAVDRSTNSSIKTHKDEYTIIVDNIAPTGKLSFNNPYQNKNNVSYYAGDINVSVAIKEANFDSRKVNITVKKDGAEISPKVNWRSSGTDNHTGTFTLTEDGDYTITVSYTDKSGNAMKNMSSNQLTLDTTVPTIKVSGIEANSANKGETIGFTIEINDENLDVDAMKPVLMAVVKDAEGHYTSKQIDLGEPTAVVKGQTYTYTVENLIEDALYTLTYEAKDLAGNATKSATLDDGKAYEEVQFSINRSGSTFALGDEYTESLMDQYYVYQVYNDVVMAEINVDPIENYEVLLNGEALTEGVDFTSEQTSNPGEWSKRVYIIDKGLFDAEGEYSLVINSTDKTATTAYSDIKDLSAAFVVDQTAPVLTISGLETGGRYQTNEQTVTVIPTDEGGRLNSVKVLVFDSKGEPLTDETGKDISLRFEMSGEEFLKFLEENDGKFTFTVPEGLNLKVQIICDDCALKDDGTTNEYNELFERVTVSQNQFVIFYANTPLFIGAIILLLALIFFIIILLARKKKKDEK